MSNTVYPTSIEQLDQYLSEGKVCLVLLQDDALSNYVIQNIDYEAGLTYYGISRKAIWIKNITGFEARLEELVHSVPDHATTPLSNVLAIGVSQNAVARDVVLRNEKDSHPQFTARLDLVWINSLDT